jgi:hypothetical protein
LGSCTPEVVANERDIFCCPYLRVRAAVDAVAVVLGIPIVKQFGGEESNVVICDRESEDADGGPSMAREAFRKRDPGFEGIWLLPCYLFGTLKTLRSNSSLRPPTMNRDLPKIAVFHCLVERGAVREILFFSLTINLLAP